MKNKINEDNVGLPDFLFMTNFVEGRGYELQNFRTKKGIIGRIRFNKGAWKYGKIVYQNNLDCQEGTARKIYKMLIDK